MAIEHGMAQEACAGRLETEASPPTRSVCAKKALSKRMNGETQQLNRYCAVDLFCGAGGLSEGFRQAGFTIVAGSDNDPDAMATYAANFPEAQAITGDIRRPEIKERILEAARHASVLIGGPP